MTDASKFGHERVEKPDMAALERPMCSAASPDLEFARPRLEAYTRDPRTRESDSAWAAIGHYRLATVAAEKAMTADPVAADFDLYAGSALRHMADSVEQAGYWLAEAFDLRLPPRVRAHPGNRELAGRLAFLDPVISTSLQARRVWLSDIAAIGRRVTRSPVTFRSEGSALIAAPVGQAEAEQAISGHLEELREFLIEATQAIDRNAAAGGRQREAPDEAWLND
ncbi:MAG: hypothetical protein CL790_00735 [Chloroflexi bacterium]|nr:hypothetical protein [Chloroflexota bacterium]HCU72645.1 hypothetical protein [Chloroflexota bacterium]